MKRYLLFYEKAPDAPARQGAFAAAHREHIRGYEASGSLLLGGNLDDGGALILFACEDGSVPSRFAEDDPYVREGIVVRWRVQAWDVVVGTRLPST